MARNEIKNSWSGQHWLTMGDVLDMLRSFDELLDEAVEELENIDEQDDTEYYEEPEYKKGA